MELNLDECRVISLKKVTKDQIGNISKAIKSTNIRKGKRFGHDNQQQPNTNR